MADDLCCSICMFRFNETSYLPLWLKCGHTFCKSCLEDIARRGKLKCPNCNCEEETSVENLPKNFFVMEMIVRGLLSRTPSATEEPWICKMHPTEQLSYYAPRSKLFLCSECVKFSNEPKTVNVDKIKTKGLLKPYGGFYEAASPDDMDARLAFLDHLESCMRGEAARLLLYEKQLHDSALLALEAAAGSCRRNVESYYDGEAARIDNATGVLKCLRELKELGQGFEIMERISVAKQMEIIPPLFGVTIGRTAASNDRPEGKFPYKFPATAMQISGLLSVAGSRIFQESSSGEDVNEYKISRFSATGNRWGIYEDKNQVEAVTFTVSKPVFVTGVGIGTCYNPGKTVTVHELAIVAGNSSGGSKIAVISSIVVPNVDNTVRIAKLTFPKPVEISALQDYSIRLVAKGEAGVYRGQNSQQVVTGPKQVEFTFKPCSYVPADIKNGDNQSDGPILEVYYQMSAAEQLTISRFSDFAPGWVPRAGSKDAISFQTDKSAKLNGVSVCSPTQAGPAQVSIEVLEGGKCPGKLIYALPVAVLLTFSAEKVAKILFPTPVVIKAGSVYTVVASVTSPGVHKGVGFTSPVAKQGNLSVQFFETVFDGASQPNGRNLDDGPIAHLHFGDVIESENLYCKCHSALGSIESNLSEKAGGELRLRRFQGLERGWEVVKDRKEALTFKVDTPMLLTGFGLAAAVDAGQAVTVTGVRVLAGQSIESKVIYASVDSKLFYTLPDSEPLHRIFLTEPVELSLHRYYTVLVSLAPGILFHGSGAREVMALGTEGQCVFAKTTGAKEGTLFSGEASGPIVELFLAPVECSAQQVKEQIASVLSDRIEAQGHVVQFTRYSGTGSSWHVNSDGKQVEAITFKTTFTGQLVAVGLGNSNAEGSQIRIKTLELRRGPGTRGEVTYQHGQQVILQRRNASDAFVKVPLTRGVVVVSGEFYTIRVQYEENGVVVRGTGVSNSLTEEGMAITFQRSNFESGDVENGSHETHGPLRDFYFLIG